MSLLLHLLQYPYFLYPQILPLLIGLKWSLLPASDPWVRCKPRLLLLPVSLEGIMLASKCIVSLFLLQHLDSGMPVDQVTSCRILLTNLIKGFWNFRLPLVQLLRDRETYFSWELWFWMLLHLCQILMEWLSQFQEYMITKFIDIVERLFLSKLVMQLIFYHFCLLLLPGNVKSKLSSSLFLTPLSTLYIIVVLLFMVISTWICFRFSTNLLGLSQSLTSSWI